MRLAMLPYPGVAMGPDPRMPASLPPLPTLSCAPETRRILNYATNIASGIVAGPDADLALFSRHPLDVYTLVQRTWIDGVLVFDRSAEGGQDD